MTWVIVCPDGSVRHFPYNNQGDAELDASVCTVSNCNIYGDTDPNTPALSCPGGQHTVRPQTTKES